ncbi:hypothetical protein GGF31_003477, partial [Allomyces arbusculus]
MSDITAITLPASLSAAPITTGAISAALVGMPMGQDLSKYRAPFIAIKQRSLYLVETNDKIKIINLTGKVIRVACTIFMGFNDQWLELHDGGFVTWQLVNASWHECVMAEDVATGTRAAVLVYIGSEVTFYAVDQTHIEEHELRIVEDDQAPHAAVAVGVGTSAICLPGARICVVNKALYPVQVCRVLDLANAQWSANERFQRIMGFAEQLWWKTLKLNEAMMCPPNRVEVIAVQYSHYGLKSVNSAMVATMGQVVHMLEPEPFDIIPPWNSTTSDRITCLPAGTGRVGDVEQGTPALMPADAPLIPMVVYASGRYEMRMRRYDDGDVATVYIPAWVLAFLLDMAHHDMVPPISIHVYAHFSPHMGPAIGVHNNLPFRFDVDVRVTELMPKQDALPADETWITVKAGGQKKQ